MEEMQTAALIPSSVTSSEQRFYAHRRIQPWQIRVLELFPDEEDAPLQGRLMHASLVTQYGERRAVCEIDEQYEVLRYRAISYTWGSTEKKAAISIEGFRLPITSNLHAGLKAIRDREESALLWADAICIDQNSIAERSEQVANMLRIFQTADEVVVWLGEADSFTSEAFQWMNGLDLSQRFEIRMNARTHESVRGALVHLYSRSWLRRMWVRQEVHAARSIVVASGSYRTSWQAFLEGKHLLSSPHLYEGEATALSRERNDIVDLLSCFEQRKEASKNDDLAPRDFAQVLSSSSLFQVTMPQDTVYAVLGMCGVPTTGMGIIVDYNKSIDEVWFDVACFLMRQPSRSVRARSLFYNPSSKAGTITSQDLSGAAALFNHSMRLLRKRKYSVPNQALEQQIAEAGRRASWVTDWRRAGSLWDVANCMMEGSMLRKTSSFFPYTYFPDVDLSEFPEFRSPSVNTDMSLTMSAFLVACVERVTDRTFDLSDPYHRGLTEKFRGLDFKGCPAFDASRDSLRWAIVYKPMNRKKSNVLVPDGSKPGDMIYAGIPGAFPLVLSPKEDFLKTLALAKTARSLPHFCADMQSSTLAFTFRGVAISAWDFRSLCETLGHRSVTYQTITIL